MAASLAESIHFRICGAFEGRSLENKEPNLQSLLIVPTW